MNSITNDTATINRRPEVIVFDADDTLWDCQGHFEQVMQELYTMLLPWTETRERAAAELFATERKNMPALGFGVKAFTLSMLETAMRVSRCEMPAKDISQLLTRCYSLLEFPCTPLPEVEMTLQTLHDRRQRMVLFTKGELLDQQRKLNRSGLGPYFEHVEITSDKSEKEFLQLCHTLRVDPRQVLMVGNSLKSDIAPALAVGCSAVYIPFHVTWELEHQEHFTHPRMLTISHFSELLSIVNEQD